MKICYYGVRGSIPTPGRETIRYGGNTPCVAVRCDGELFILDAGTGLRVLGEELMEGPFGRGGGRATLLVTHTHWDHIQGFPFFRPAYVPGNSFQIAGMHQINKGLETAMHHQQQYQNFPVLLNQMPARIVFNALSEDAGLSLGDTTISTTELNHPGGACAYRVEYKGHAVVYATDTEHYASIDLRLLNLCLGADLLIYDTTYSPAEYAEHRGWGHSTYAEGVRLARAAGVKALHMFHHHPSHTDEMMEAMLVEARELFPNIHLAREGWELDLG
ncbi:MAG: MBL fold metallo-hydrolase [Deltaproteobacteria bacterium]|nr:MBL fold metallo-hydrolase [Deltaproteobacteria bacterium]